MFLYDKLRSRFRFSIRALLIAVTLLAAFLGWYVTRTAHQRQAVLKVRKLGGTIVYGSGGIQSVIPRFAVEALGDDFFFPVGYVDLGDCQRSDEDLIALESLPRLRGLNLWNTGVSDSGLVHIQSLRRLRFLDLGKTHVTGRGLSYLSQMRELNILNLNDATDVDDEGIRRISQLTELEDLAVWHTKLTDEGMGYLGQIPALRSLVAGGTSITDEGVSNFANSATMERLVLQDAAITDRALRYISSMPNIEETVVSDNDVSDVGVAELHALGSGPGSCEKSSTPAGGRREAGRTADMNGSLVPKIPRFSGNGDGKTGGVAFGLDFSQLPGQEATT